MKTRFIMRLTALTLLMQLGGCASARSRWPFQSEPQPAAPPANHVRRQAVPTTASTDQPKREGNGSERPAPPRKEPSIANVPAQTPPASVKTTSVTLVDNDADHVRAQALVDDADARLARIDRSKLTGESATAYNQATNLASAARQAMTQQDYLAASGLARKATLLTEQLASRTPSR
jgi:hypothetical protein